ncbi:MAG: peptidase M61 [Polaromonas sp.]|uniref:M61 family metallopeptidase n=1 Tax=Polaromonas sp. TaxID=1869339 RepID=UPI00248A37EF|nr:peptidase M61 [Polaromonas sp.]MDI1237790.1 peptidase M61 [Polaromonas sp.]
MPKPSAKPSAIPPVGVDYRVEVADLHAHLFRVTLTIAQPAALQRVALPVWIPGSYLVREFSKNLQGLRARQGARALPAGQIAQLDKCSWQIRCNADRPLVLVYEVYANDSSVRTASLDAGRGFFNGSSLCLRVEGHDQAPHRLEVMAAPAISGWSVATGLDAVKVDKQGFGSYLAANYDELVDCPVEMGNFWSGSFVACGVPHRFVVAGATASFDGARLLADTRKICEAQIRLWHGNKKPPHKDYVFMLHAVDDGYGGLEHRNSTALICKRQDLPRLGSSKLPEGYTTLRGLISHEYFHTWNVKRLRPAEFGSYNYSGENYTQLLWFFEGFTSYYDELILCRAGLIDEAAYLRLLNKTINQVMQTPGRLVQSVAQASFDAWVKYYRQDENTPNATVSYYTKGALVALCLDLSLRAESKDTVLATLDDVMRSLWLRCRGGVMCEADVAAALQGVGGRSYAAEIARWVHGKSELPLKDLLQRHGVAVLEEPAQLAQALGLRVQETGGSIHVKTVLRGGAAERAGFAAGDEWIGLETPVTGKSRKTAQLPHPGWRLGKLDELPFYAGASKKITALVARDKRLLRLELTIPPETSTWRLQAKDAALVKKWLVSASGT